MEKLNREQVSVVSLIVSLVIIISTATYMFAIVEADLKNLSHDVSTMQQQHNNMQHINERYLNLNSRVMILEFIYDNENLQELQGVFKETEQGRKRSKPQFCAAIPKETLGEQQ